LNRITTPIPTATKAAKATICVITNGGSDCVGAFAFRDGLEGLHDQDKDIQIEGQLSPDHVNPAPSACQLKRIAREDCGRKHHK